MGVDMANPQPQQANSLDLMADALAMMRDALRTLDDAQAPADVGAHLDRAIVRLEQAIVAAGETG